MHLLFRLKNGEASAFSRRWATPLFWMIYMSVFALVVTHQLVLNMVNTGPPRSWDGTGHYAIAQIYDSSIFPDTFGWVNSYFAGMPFPNFYPPLFFWLVALLHHTHLLSFAAAFKSMVLIPILIAPTIMWILAWVISKRDFSVAFWASFLSLFPLIDPRFGGQFNWSSGLDYFSTVAIGLYTQPLGFVLLIVWYITYLYTKHSFWRFMLSSLLLALAVLANYLNGLTSTLFIAATLVWDGIRYFRSPIGSELKREAGWTFISHAISPFISFGLTLFWLVPMFSSYRYFVTRPFTDVVFTRPMMLWYAAAVIGVFCWRKRSNLTIWPYVSVCLVLIAILLFAKTISPRWYPLQANRLSPTLNFLLAVPVGYAVATILRLLKEMLATRLPSSLQVTTRLKPYAQALFAILLVVMGYQISQSWEMRVLGRLMKTLSFYPPPEALSSLANSQPIPSRGFDASLLRNKAPAAATREELFGQSDREHAADEQLSAQALSEINAILSFARDHRDGRYAVEFPDMYDFRAGSYDARALNSYLGVQGNESLIVVFREASTSSVFMYPQLNALSFNSDSFGISSVLADDYDFFEQPLARHLERARLLGMKYFVVYTAKMKERLANEPTVGTRHDFPNWSVFEMKDGPPPKIQVLPYRPALLVTDFTLKGRFSNEANYLRFAEEQFADDWFDVRLVRSPDTMLDRLGSLAELNQFGAIILDTYKCTRCELVYRQLKDYAQNRPLILLMSNEDLFDRIRTSIIDFPNAEVIERTTEDPPIWLDNRWPRHRYGSSAIRQQWLKIRSILESHKIPTEPASVSGEIKPFEITIDYQGEPGASSPGVPVLINTSFHPNWQSNNVIYMGSPMFMLTFVHESTRLHFARRSIDYLGLWASAVVLVMWFGLIAWHYRWLLIRSVQRKFLTTSEPGLEEFTPSGKEVS